MYSVFRTYSMYNRTTPIFSSWQATVSPLQSAPSRRAERNCDETLRPRPYFRCQSALGVPHPLFGVCDFVLLASKCNM